MVFSWLTAAILLSVLAGSSSAFFLWALDVFTQQRISHPQWMWALPVFGFISGLTYGKWGKSVEAGNNLVLTEIQQPHWTLPLRMAPMVLWGTLLAHWGGASIGREGTAVQMAASLGDSLTRFKLWKSLDRSLWLTAAVAGGFAAVFGTPWSGALFAIEVVTFGRWNWRFLPLAMVVAWGSHGICIAWGGHHTIYTSGELPIVNIKLFFVILLLGLLSGAIARAFIISTRFIGGLYARFIPFAPLRPMLGGVILMVVLLETPWQRFAGLGIPVIQDAFVHPAAWSDTLGKWAMTVFSLGSGFKGGEVTPLFHIGATLGSSWASWWNLPIGFFATLGFVAVFAGATNTLLASTVLALEMFGGAFLPWAFLVNLAAILVSGHPGIYKAQGKAFHQRSV